MGVREVFILCQWAKRGLERKLNEMKRNEMRRGGDWRYQGESEKREARRNAATGLGLCICYKRETVQEMTWPY